MSLFTSLQGNKAGLAMPFLGPTQPPYFSWAFSEGHVHSPLYHHLLLSPAASGYGTQNIRLSRDAVKDFDCCCLSLQPCHDPVVT